jgi:hypothetical protein
MKTCSLIEEMRIRLFYFLERGPFIVKRENSFQAELIKEIYHRFPGCLVLKNDEQYIQGIPDLTVLFKDKWAVLECKKSLDEPYQPNQKYYLEVLDSMFFAAMICPENKEAVLRELQLAFKPRRTACFSQRQ